MIFNLKPFMNDMKHLTVQISGSVCLLYLITPGTPSHKLQWTNPASFLTAPNRLCFIFFGNKTVFGLNIDADEPKISFLKKYSV